MMFSSISIWIVDVVGSILMIVFSFLCLRLVRRLRARDPGHLIWTYLLWVCLALTVFAVSRSAGHILKQVLILTGNTTVWVTVRPFSGAINTFMLTVVGAVTLFFERIWSIYQQILKDKQELQSAHAKLIYMNQNLENLVTERTQALALSENMYRRIFEVSRDMILVSDMDGRIVDLNPAGYQMLGFNNPEELAQGQYLQAYFCDPGDWQRIKGMTEKEGFVQSVEVGLKRRDGACRQALISGSLDLEAANKQHTIHFVVKDIEQRRMMEKQMAQADKLASIGQLSAGIAHEINNPLGVILGYTQLLLRSESAGTERHGDLKTIEKHVRHCKTIVEDLLNFARSSEPQKDMVNLNNTIDDVLNFIQQHSKLDDTQIVKDYDTQIPLMRLDEKKMRQVLMNLIMNAKHAVGSGGMIRITTRVDPPEGQVVIQVTDTGYGIKPEDLPRIFDPFFTTKPTGEGTGLGLSVSYGIVKNHGGEILVESESGNGSAFTVRLPVAGPGLREG